MATEVEVPQKIYCCGDRQQYDPMAMIAMMNGGGFGNGFNNPLSYILVMWMMRYMRENGMYNGDNYNSRALAQLQNTVDSNHNNQVVLDAMSNNQAAIRELAQVFNTDINVVQQGICAIKSAIETVGGQIGYSVESVKNAVALGDQSIIKQLCDCCCSTKTAIYDTSSQIQREILNQGYQSQLGVERQTNILGTKIDTNHSADMLQDCQYHGQLMDKMSHLDTVMQQGFANTGYLASQNTSKIIENATANTQRIMDLLNNRWYTETSQALQDSKNEVSQLKQTQTILQALSKNSCVD